MADKKDPREGHRRRLRERFAQHGLAKFTEAEVLELLLSFGTPRRDCKPVARAMLRKFGTIRDVFEAPPEELAQIPGAGPANIVAIKFINAVAGKYLEQRLVTRDYFTSSQQVIEYLRHDLETLDREVFKVIFLDAANAIISLEDLSYGSAVETRVYAKQILERAGALKSTGLIFVHNHPSGQVEPSWEDQRLTRRLVHVSFLAEMTVLDHIIIGRDGGFFSFKNSGLLALYEQEIKETYRLDPRLHSGSLLPESVAARLKARPRKTKTGPFPPRALEPETEARVTAAEKKTELE